MSKTLTPRRPVDHKIELEPEALRRPPELSELRKQLKGLIDAASSGLGSFRTCRLILFPSFVLVPGGYFFSVGLLSRQRECAFALFLRPVMLFPARHALTLSTAFLVSRPVAAAASVKARSERDICGAVPVPLWRDLRQLRSAELPSTQPCKTWFRIPLILKLV